MRPFATLGAAVLAGCAGAPPQTEPLPAPVAPAVAAETSGQGAEQRYRCEQDIAFTVRFENDSAFIDAGARGRETLLRDAGGLTPQHTVWSNPRMRAEFGLGPEGREASLHDPAQTSTVRCVAG